MVYNIQEVIAGGGGQFQDFAASTKRNAAEHLQPFSAHVEHFTNRQIVTTQMLLNSKCLDKLVVHNECG